MALRDFIIRPGGLLAALLSFFLAVARVSGGEAEDRAVAVRAGFLLNFVKFTTWPEAVLPEKAPLIVGVAGSDSSLQILSDQLNGKEVQGHVIQVIPVSPDFSEAVHVVFVDRAGCARGGLRQDGHGVLWVGDAPDFASSAPGVLAFFERDGKVRFRLSLEHARAQGLQLSSRLASIAERVVP